MLIKSILNITIKRLHDLFEVKNNNDENIYTHTRLKFYILS